jgi:Peptidase family C78
MDLQPCPFCGKSFPAYQYLAGHIERRHTDDSESLAREDYDDESQSWSASPEPRAAQDDDGPPPPTRPAPAAPEAESDDALEGADGSEEGSFFEYGCCPLEECEEQVPLSEMDEHIEFHQMQMALNGSQPQTTPSEHHSSISSANGESYHSTHTSFYAPDSSKHATPSSVLPSDAEPPSFPAKPREESDRRATGPSPTSGKMAQRRDPQQLRRRAPNRVGGFLGRLFESRDSGRPQRHRRSRQQRSRSNLRLGVSWSSASGLRSNVQQPSELGPHAYEGRMPKWLLDQLVKGPKIKNINTIGRDGRLIQEELIENETSGIVPILARLSELDPRVQYAYYCHPDVIHISKMNREGGFCGFRNLQMQISYIQGAKAQGHEHFGEYAPGILQLQDWIEEAWSNGIHEISKQQFGRLKGTRKWIGSSEVRASLICKVPPANSLGGCSLHAPWDRAQRLGLL